MKVNTNEGHFLQDTVFLVKVLGNEPIKVDAGPKGDQ